MPNFTYNRDIPDAPNNPSNDQQPMKVNTNSTDHLINEDHYSFNDNKGGLHKRVRLVDLLAIPGGLASGIGTLYAKAPVIGSQLIYTPDNSGNEYQLTRTISSQFPLFGKLTQDYNSVGLPYFGGWTFLPGNGSGAAGTNGLLLQYGRTVGVADLSATKFPVPFTTQVFSIQATIFMTGGSARNFINVDQFTLTQFTTNQVDRNNSSINLDFFWIAIGI